MKPLSELTTGLELLQPFLSMYGFKLENCENEKGSGGQFTVATYMKDDKKLVIGYRYSIGELYYQHGSLKVGHDYYLKQLGYEDKMKFPDFQSDDKLQTFRNVLHDFELLKSDFFEGDCVEFKRIEKLQEGYLNKLQMQSKINGQNEADLTRIEEARQKFKNKDYRGSLRKYETVIHKNLFSNFDQSTIDYLTKKMS